mmetsp:Transcript_17483/g.40173  ORF Transcript_17483/g.40173 Transcript_17483/m.40173 type:complete len:212 (-) Transcript_17483:121-756(-)
MPLPLLQLWTRPFGKPCWRLTTRTWTRTTTLLLPGTAMDLITQRVAIFCHKPNSSNSNSNNNSRSQRIPCSQLRSSLCPPSLLPLPRRRHRHRHRRQQLGRATTDRNKPSSRSAGGNIPRRRAAEPSAISFQETIIPPLSRRILLSRSILPSISSSPRLSSIPPPTTLSWAGDPGTGVTRGISASRPCWSGNATTTSGSTGSSACGWSIRC